jgi:glutamate-1-semialdehyde 2,1-aminomutase
MVYGTLDAAGQRSQPYRTLFLQELLDRGVIAPSLVVSVAHTDSDIDRTVEIVGQALRTYGKALEDGVDRYLRGRPVKPVFRPYA